jgi:hypothetical protein
MEKEIRFPDYCCYGKRQSGQLVETEDGITAVYEMFGFKVHQLSYDKTRGVWTFREFSPEGKGTMFTCNKQLDRAVCQHALYSVNEKNELLKHLRNELLKFGPVWLAPLPSFSNGDESIVYHPAGKLLAVRLLLSAGAECGSHLETVQELEKFHDPETRLNLRIHDFYETSLIINRENGSAYWHMAFVAEFVVPLAFVYDSVKLFSDKGLINLNGLDRVIIQDAPMLRNSEEMGFYLKTIPGAISYTVMFKGMLKPPEEFNQQRKEMEQKYNVESF